MGNVLSRIHRRWSEFLDQVDAKPGRRQVQRRLDAGDAPPAHQHRPTRHAAVTMPCCRWRGAARLGCPVESCSPSRREGEHDSTGQPNRGGTRQRQWPWWQRQRSLRCGVGVRRRHRRHPGVAGSSAAGFRVFLVEESPTIGGGMARLDKTFPTGDCATCIISPKLVACMRDYNIDVLTMADVSSLDGEAGRFVADVRTRPRGVMAAKCTGCGDCWTTARCGTRPSRRRRFSRANRWRKPTRPGSADSRPARRPTRQRCCPSCRRSTGPTATCRA